MAYTSFWYLLFLTILVPVYYLFPKRFRWVTLLAGNVIFYLQAGIAEFILLTASVAASYAAARLMGSVKDKKRKKTILLLSLAVVLGLLLICRYTNFFLKQFFRIIPGAQAPVLRLIVPLGMSFYTFQMVAYLVDVYKGKIQAQSNFARYFLYASFFPTVTQGPIGRYKKLSEQLYEGHPVCFENIRNGSVLILWGIAKKLIVAERLNAFTSTIFDHFAEYHGQIFLFAAAVYSIQIYADFSGCMDIAAGTARLFDIRLEKNFLRPYFAVNMPEFWRRWHATLGSWFRDYVFFPFSISGFSRNINRTARKKLGEKAGRIVSACVPVLVVWFLTGLWHGPKLSYVAWGLWHGMLIMLSTVFAPSIAAVCKKSGIRTETFSFRLFRMARTFYLCCIGRVFFRAGSVRASLLILRSMFTATGLWRLMPRHLFACGMSGRDFLIVAVFLAAWLCVSILQERGLDVLESLFSQNLVFRWGLLYILLFAVLLLGRYGGGYDVSSFIYEQF